MEVTSENESLLRTYHPSLSMAPSVYILTDKRARMWVVQAGGCFRVRHTRIGGLEVHVVPWMETPHPIRYMGVKQDMIPRVINSRRFLTAQDLDIVRSMFPTAIGIRVFIAKYVIVLYSTSQDMMEAWSEGSPDTLGGLYLGYSVAEHTSTMGEIALGRGLSHKSDGIPRSCLGLRLNVHGKPAITTTTHGLVKMPPAKPVSVVSDWFSRATKALRRFHPLKRTQGFPAEVRGFEIEDSSLGNTVWAAFTKQKVGTMAYTYDNPHPRRPFPCGYTHDLSLVTGPELPWLTSLPGVAVINEWATYEEALDGAPVFLCVLDAYKSRDETFYGDVASPQTQQAIVEGVQYTWERQQFMQRAAILWRLEEEDWRHVVVASGGVLCVGKPTDQFAKALEFQNFETPIKPWRIRGRDKELDGERNWTIKGGFVLPQEIRESEIQHGESQKTQNLKHVKTVNSSAIIDENENNEYVADILWG